jgi:hypothetical protein
MSVAAHISQQHELHPGSYVTHADGVDRSASRHYSTRCSGLGCSSSMHFAGERPPVGGRDAESVIQVSLPRDGIVVVFVALNL